MDQAFRAFHLVPDDRAQDDVEDAAPAPAAMENGFDALPLRCTRKRSQQQLPSGVAHRSAGHMELIRKERKLMSKDRQHETDMKGAEALGEAWDREVGLRAGDRAAIGQQEPAAQQPNQWTPLGMMQAGFREVANKHSHGAGAAGVGETRNGLKALISLASIARRACVNKFHEWLHRLPGKVMHVERHHDPTQLKLNFGPLQQELQASGRYAIPDDSQPGRYKIVGWKEYHARFPKAQPARGYVEFFAQTLECTTVYPKTGIEDARAPLLPPSILLHADASTTYAAVEIETLELTLAKLNQVASQLRLVTVSEIPDNNSVNRRKKAFTARQLGPNILYAPGGCAAHLLHRCICVAIAEKNIIGHVHAVHVISRSTRHKERLIAAMNTIIEESWFYHAGPPPQENAMHMKQIMDHTILRRLDHVTGVVSSEPLPADPSEIDDGPRLELKEGELPFSSRRQGASLIYKFLNADPRMPRVGHYCQGCCRSEAEAMANVKAAALQWGPSRRLLFHHTLHRPTRLID